MLKSSACAAIAILMAFAGAANSEEKAEMVKKGASAYRICAACHSLQPGVHLSGPSLAGWLWTAAGGLVMAMLMVARHHFIWWPLHPLGFVVSPGWAMDNIWFSVFLAWGIKVLVLKYGGPGVYAKTRPFFLGVVLGQFVVGGMWLVIDSFTGTVGNSVPVY